VVRFFLFCNVLLLFPVCGDALSSSSSPIPITILSGFLGSGKTTLLQHLLHNKEGLKIAVIVNDVASVNIDNKLLLANNNNNNNNNEVASTLGKPDSMIQLSNGCACCSLSDELLSSVSEIVTLSDLRAEGEMFDHIVIELSGVSEPMSVRAKFQDAAYFSMPLMERVCLDTMVTVVDCSTFLNHLRDGKAVSRDESPDLFFRNEEERLSDKKEWEETGKMMEALRSGDYMNDDDDDSSSSAVSDLIVQQTEIADVVVLNKVDAVDDDQVGMIEQIVQRLNSKATIFRARFGKIPLTQILATAKGQGAALSGIVDDHKDAIQAAERDQIKDDHDHQHNTDDCTDQNCNDPSHNHHSHDHSHDHNDEVDNDTCTDPTCTDASHKHSHESSSSSSSGTTFAGIGSYVYRARKPFHPDRLAAFLRHLPVTRGKPSTGSKEDFEKQGLEQTLANIVRSKGFVWLADSHEAAMYWSHAGSSFEMKCVGSWWATLPQSQWPEEARNSILSDFDKKDYDLNMKFDLDASGVGDRRQEIVFIGTRVPQEKICVALDKCLLTKEEMQEYKSCVNEENEQNLPITFVNPIPSKIDTY